MKSYNFVLINADTDAISIAKPDGAEFSQEEQDSLLEELNSLYPELITFEDDGYFSSFVVWAAKNYAIKEAGQDKIYMKGSSIKDAKKEAALKEMLIKMVEDITHKTSADYNALHTMYTTYLSELHNLTNIRRWCQKKTITKPILECKGWKTRVDMVPNKAGELKEKVIYYNKNSDNLRLNEIQVWEALKDTDHQEGDKVWVYPVELPPEVITGRVGKNGKPLKDLIKKKNGLKLDKNWTGDHHVAKLEKRLIATLNILSNVLDTAKVISNGI